MIRQTGIILTNAPSLAVVGDAISRGGYDTLKVIDGWGLPGGWTPATIALATRLAPNLIVRTRAGDPSLDGRWGGDWTMCDQHRVEAGLYIWARERPDLWIELGNEPNVFNATERQMFEYAYFLTATIARCRVAFPKARLMAPAMIVDRPSAEPFMRICKEAMDRCDAIAIHAYEWDRFDGPVAGRKGELERALSLAADIFPGMPLFLSEYGIHNPKLSSATKGARYAGLVHGRQLPDRLFGATAYHLNVLGDIQPEYNIYPKGDVAYHQARFGVVTA